MNLEISITLSIIHIIAIVILIWYIRRHIPAMEKCIGTIDDHIYIMEDFLKEINDERIQK